MPEVTVVVLVVDVLEGSVVVLVAEVVSVVRCNAYGCGNRSGDGSCRGQRCSGCAHALVVMVVVVAVLELEFCLSSGCVFAFSCK